MLESGSGSESSSTSAVAEPRPPAGQSITPCPAGMKASTRSAPSDRAEIGRGEAEAEHARPGIRPGSRLVDHRRKLPRHDLPDGRGVEIAKVDDVEIHGPHYSRAGDAVETCRRGRDFAIAAFWLITAVSRALVPETFHARNSTWPSSSPAPTISACFSTIRRAARPRRSTRPTPMPIIKALQARGWRLAHIFVTHKHFDHIEGIPALKAAYDCEVIGPEKSAAETGMYDRTVKDGDSFDWAGAEVRVIETPGHTLDHVSYSLPDEKLVFVGDTIFSLGCGRVIEGNHAMMWDSLKRLRELPDETELYCGHEYTLANAKFAITVDPGERGADASAWPRSRSCAREGKPTLPTTIGREKATNPFLRVRRPGGDGGGRHGRRRSGAGLRRDPQAQGPVLTAHDPLRRRGHPPARAAAASGGRAFSRDVSRRARPRRPRPFHRDLLPAEGRRALALAPRRRRRDLAFPCRRALAPAPLRQLRPGRDDPPRRRSCGGRAAAGHHPRRRLAIGGKPRRVDAGRLHRRARLPIRGLRAGAARLGARLGTASGPTPRA